MCNKYLIVALLGLAVLAGCQKEDPFTEEEQAAEVPEDAYLLTLQASDDLALYRLGDGSLIPAGCAVVIMADESALTNVTPEFFGTLTLYATADDPVGVSDGLLEANILRGTSANTPRATLITGTQRVYVLGEVLDGSKRMLTFRPFGSPDPNEDATLPAGVAYYVK